MNRLTAGTRVETVEAVVLHGLRLYAGMLLSQSGWDFAVQLPGPTARSRTVEHGLIVDCDLHYVLTDAEGEPLQRLPSMSVTLPFDADEEQIRRAIKAACKLGLLPWLGC